MQRNRMIIWGTILLTLVLSMLALLLPTPAGWPEQVGFHNALIVNIVMACSHAGGVVLLLTNLDVYKAKLRRAYIVMSVGVLAAGLGTLQILIVTLLNWSTSLYAQSGAIIAPFLLSGVLLYIAVRSFARLVGVKHLLTRAWIVLPGAIVLAALSSLLPHAYDPRIPEAVYDAFVGIMVWSGSLMLFAGWLVLSVRRYAGTHYSHAMIWLMRALFVSASLLLYSGVLTLLNGSDNLALNILSYILSIAAGLMWVRAGYAFALTKYYDKDIPLWRQLFGGGDIDDKRPGTVVDMVTYAAGLVSNSHEIDPLLDDLRVVTARLGPGEKLSPNDTRRLVGVYLKIEQYLTKREVLRTFTAKELRSHLTPELQKLVQADEKLLT